LQLLEKSLFLLQSSRILGWSRSRQLGRVTCGHVTWDGQQAENDFKVTCEHMKHRFLDFTQVAF